MHKEIIYIALRAWLVGLLSAGLVLLPAMVASSGFSFEKIPHELVFRATLFAAVIPPSMMIVFTLGVLLSLPLFAIILLVVLTFRRRIESHPNLFILLAPVATAGYVIGLEALLRAYPLALSHGIEEEPVHMPLSWTIAISVLPVLVAAIYYCWQSRQLPSSRE